MQKRLGLSDQQIQELDEIRLDLKSGYDLAVENSGSLDDVDKADYLRTVYRDIYLTANKRAKALLTTKQLRRAKELLLRHRLQYEGVLSLLHSSDVVEELQQLNLSPVQTDELVKAAQNAEAKMKQRIAELNKEYKAAVAQLQIEAHDSVLSLLSKNQQEIVATALGKEPLSPETTDGETSLAERFGIEE